jgi:hypothetical protein
MIYYEMAQLERLMNGEDKATLARMISFFSVPGKYLHPRELKIFWDSLTDSEKNEWRWEMKCLAILRLV